MMSFLIYSFLDSGKSDSNITVNIAFFKNMKYVKNDLFSNYII